MWAPASATHLAMTPGNGDSAVRRPQEASRPTTASHLPQATRLPRCTHTPLLIALYASSLPSLRAFAAVTGMCAGNTELAEDVDCSGGDGVDPANTQNRGAAVAGTTVEGCCEAPSGGSKPRSAFLRRRAICPTGTTVAAPPSHTPLQHAHAMCMGPRSRAAPRTYSPLARSSSHHWHVFGQHRIGRGCRLLQWGRCGPNQHTEQGRCCRRLHC